MDLPEVGDMLAVGDSFGEIESVKSVSELFAPISGEILEVNSALGDTPETVNADPHDAGWMVKVKADDVSQARLAHECRGVRRLYRRRLD